MLLQSRAVVVSDKKKAGKDLSGMDEKGERK
jgi:hypothetical protein